METVYQLLTQAIAPEHLLSADQINNDYAHDEMETVAHMPDLVVQPTTTEEVAQVMKIAASTHTPVTTRGAGTGLVGGAVAINGGLLLDLAHMDQILELDETNACLTTQAGVMLQTVAAFAKDHGFLYAPDPGEKTATIGGNIATNAGGMRAVKYGVTRNAVLALTVVTAAGEILHLGGKVAKNSSGFDLKDLFIGSEGTLGIVCEATLKLLPLPAFSTSLLIPFSDYAAAIAAVPLILHTGTTPTALEFFEADSVKYWEAFAHSEFPEHGYAAYLLLTFDGHTEAGVEDAYESVAELCLEHDAVDAFVLDDADMSKQVWTARDSFLEAIKASTPKMDEVDVVVPRSVITAFLTFVHDYAKAHQIRITGFGHAGDGNLHLYICQDQIAADAWPSALTTTFDALYQKATALNGKISGEHGIGVAKRDYLATTSAPATIATMRALKQALDPAGLLNPGKVI